MNIIDSTFGGDMPSEPIWEPSAEKIEKARMTDYMRYVNASRQRRLTSYRRLYEWSITEIADFWSSIWNYGDIIH
jgi:acetoacetyl-CoA synthetase